MLLHVDGFVSRFYIICIQIVIIKIEPNEYQYCDVANGVYEYIELIFYDQLNRAMEFRDEEVIVNLLIQLNDDK